MSIYKFATLASLSITLSLLAANVAASQRTYSYPASICIPDTTDFVDPATYAPFSVGVSVTYDGGRVFNDGTSPTYTNAVCPIIRHAGFDHVSSAELLVGRDSNLTFSCTLVSSSAEGTVLYSEHKDIVDLSVSNTWNYSSLAPGEYYWLYCDGFRQANGWLSGISVTESD